MGMLDPVCARTGCQTMLHVLLLWETMETDQFLAKLPKYWLCSVMFLGSGKPQQPDPGEAGKLAS